MIHEQLSELLESLARCITPDTGEYFDLSVFRNQDVLEAYAELSKTIDAARNLPVENEKWPAGEIYEKLRLWRNDEARLRNVNAFQVFWNRHLQAIASAPIVRIEDLQNIDGIGPYKYREYGDLIFDILKPYLDDYWGATSNALAETGPNQESEEQVVDAANQEEAEATVTSVTCRNCRRYRIEDCFGNGDPETCEYFEYVADVSPEELAQWHAIEGTVAHIRRTGHGYHD